MGPLHVETSVNLFGMVTRMRIKSGSNPRLPAKFLNMLRDASDTASECIISHGGDIVKASNPYGVSLSLRTHSLLFRTSRPTERIRRGGRNPHFEPGETIKTLLMLKTHTCVTVVHTADSL